MSIETEITRLQTAKANIKSAIEEKWGNSIPSNVRITNYADYVSSAADAQYDSGLAAGGGGGGDVGNKCVVSSGSVVINSANILKNAGIASDMTLRVSNGGIASNVVVVESANAYVLNGGRLVNPIVLSAGTVTISQGGVVSGGVAKGVYSYDESNPSRGCGVINVMGTVTGTTLGYSGLAKVSGNAPAISTTSGGTIVVFDGATVGMVSLNSGTISAGSNVSSLTVQTISGSGRVDFRGAIRNGVVVSNADIAGDSIYPGAAHFNVVILRPGAGMQNFSSGGVIDSLVLAGNGTFDANNASGTIGFLSAISSGTGFNGFQGTISSAVLDKGVPEIRNGGKISNVEILSSGRLVVNSSATANGVIVSSCASYTYSDGEYPMGFSFRFGLQVQGSSAVASNVTVLQNGSMYVVSGGFVDAPVLSSGANVYFRSGSAVNIESKTGAAVYALVGSEYYDTTSVAVTDDYFENGCSITFACPPKVTVNYAGAGTGYEVSGNGTYYNEAQGRGDSVNGRYLMYNGDTNMYKHETKELYLVYRNNYYMLASNPSVQNPGDGAYFYNSTGFTGPYSTHNGSGSISVSSFSIQPIGAWSIDDGTNWNEYGLTIFTGDAKGSLLQRTITFSSVSGYVSPSPITATMYDRNNVFEVQYMILLTVSVTNVNGAKWSIDGGTTWNDSGKSVQVPANSKQTITYNSVSVDGVPYTHESQSIEVTLSTNSVSVEYIQNPGNGTSSDPYLWSMKVDSTIGNTPGCHTVLIAAKGRGEENAIWLKAYLTSGTAYSIGADNGSDPYLYLRTMSGSTIASDDDGGNGRTIDGHSLSSDNPSYCSYLQHTPSESGYYLIGGANNGNIRFHCYPAPN